MSNPEEPIPKLGLLKLSSLVADLFLVGVGEEEAMKHRRTRAAWHLLFFSILFFLGWHVIIRIAITPSLPPSYYPYIRLIEALIYTYLLISLAILMYRHYHFMLLPRRDPRFVTIGFFFVMMVLLFSRVYYSLFHFDPNLFQLAESAITPTADFGIHGYKDVGGVMEFLIFSGCAMLNCSYSNVQSASLFISTVALIQSFTGFVFIAILVATVLEISLDSSTKK